MLQLESSCLLLYLTYVTYITGSDGKTIRKMIKKEVNAFVKNGRQLFTNNEIYLQQETKTCCNRCKTPRKTCKAFAGEVKRSGLHTYAFLNYCIPEFTCTARRIKPINSTKEILYNQNKKCGAFAVFNQKKPLYPKSKLLLIKFSFKFLTLHTLLRLGDLWERKGKPRKKSYFSLSYSFFFSKYTTHYVLRQLQTKNYFRIKFPVNQLKESPGIKLTANYHIRTTSHFDENRFW